MQLGVLCTVALALLAAAAPHAAAASSAGQVAAATAAAGSNGAKGAAKAQAAGIPVDSALLASHPEYANVPVGPPSTDSSTFAISPASTSNASLPAVTVAANSRTAMVAFKAIAANAGYVRPNGQRFTYGGKDFWPTGTSWYNMVQVEKFTEAQLDQMLRVHWQNGVRVIRMFIGIDGFKSKTPVQYPTQPTFGKYSEVALQRIDYCFFAAGRIGIRLIPVLVNFWDDFGGVQFYVNGALGPGKAPENFYTHLGVRNYFKQWMRKITQRVNTRSGRKYADDPTLFAWELCNECHTRDNVEINQKKQPGDMLDRWQWEMAGYLKTTCAVKQMVTSGNEGYRVKGRYDQYADISYPFRNWMNTGLKGEDFNRMLYNPYFDFLTLHVYPYNWQIPKPGSWVNENVIADRAALAAAANKPLLFEEYGTPRAYMNRDLLFQSHLGFATVSGLAGSVVWEVWPTLGNDEGYDFAYANAGGNTVIREFAYQNGRVAGAPNPWKVTCKCTDVAYPGRTCASIKSAGSCCRPNIQAPAAGRPYGYCQTTCGRCGCKGGKACSDVAAAGRTGNGVVPYKTSISAKSGLL